MEMIRYDGLLKNPLKGMVVMRQRICDRSSMVKMYVPWNDIEETAADGLTRVTAYSDMQWEDFERSNVKIIPRVYMMFPVVDATPADMKSGDYVSDTFLARARGLIEKMALAWDNDPRVAYIEVGILGVFGEHHSPYPSDRELSAIGDAFAHCFKQTLVMTRFPWQSMYQNYPFGIYWDEWGSDIQWTDWDNIDMVLMDRYKDRWKRAVHGGENTNNLINGRAEDAAGAWETYGLRGRFTADYAFTHAARKIIDYARLYHGNHMRTAIVEDKRLAAYDACARFHNALGYHFVLKRADAAVKGRLMTVEFTVVNEGSAPVYYDWPVEVALLHAQTKECVFRDIMDGVSAMDWMPGEEWNTDRQAWDVPPKKYAEFAAFALPDLPKGEYVVALSVLDPAGLTPSLRFANRGYIKGGYTAIARLTEDESGARVTPETGCTSAPFEDPSLRYYLNLSRYAACDCPKLIDGSMNTSMCGHDQPPKTFTVDLRAPHTLRSLEIIWDNVADYAVETSLDGIQWTRDAHRILRGREQRTRSYLPVQSARYVRVTLGKTANAAPPALRLVNVYGE